MNEEPTQRKRLSSAEFPIQYSFELLICARKSKLFFHFVICDLLSGLFLAYLNRSG